MRKCSYPVTQELGVITMDNEARHTTHLPTRRRHSRSLTPSWARLQAQSTASVSPPQIKPYPFYLLTNFQLCHTSFRTVTVRISYSPTTHRILLRANQRSVLLSTTVYTFIDSRETSLNWRKLCKNISRIFLFSHA
jgi:hypothetical protein